MRQLTKEQEQILYDGGTEPPFSGKYYKHSKKGMYVCAQCGNELFSSDLKYDTNCGWPSFFDVVNKNKVELLEDFSQSIHRIEVRCKKCNGHLGHVFNDNPKDKTKKRYCINSLALDFQD